MTAMNAVGKQDELPALKNILKRIQRSHASLLEHVSVKKVVKKKAMQNLTKIRVRPFLRRKKGFPCIKPESEWKGWDSVQHKPTHHGLLYVKTYKTGSTTVMGIAMRMVIKTAERYNRLRNTTYKACRARYDHWPAFLLDYKKRQKNNSFLFAILREPTLRAISMFFHLEVSRRKTLPSDANFQKYLTSRLRVKEPYYKWGWPYDHYLHYLSVDGYKIGSGLNNHAYLATTVNRILTEYDFIGVIERLEESLVAMQMMLGLKTSDILYSPTKDVGSWDDKGVYIQPSFVSPGMEEFFASDTWKELSKGDYLLYLAANASLDRTIASLGRKKFDEKLGLFRYAMTLTLTNCPKTLPYWTAAGKANKTDCLVTDSGCGSKCFDRLERKFKI